ncbi:hypothetical protein V8G54_029090, partial [Vigna mungo]
SRRTKERSNAAQPTGKRRRHNLKKWHFVLPRSGYHNSLQKPDPDRSGMEIVEEGGSGYDHLVFGYGSSATPSPYWIRIPASSIRIQTLHCIFNPSFHGVICIVSV